MATLARYTVCMADLLFVLAVVVFFALAALFVRACRTIVGDDLGGGGER